MKKERRKFSAEFKFKVVLEALRERETLAALAVKHQIHPQQITDWKRAFLEQGEQVFSNPAELKDKDTEEKISKLYEQIGMLKVENDFLKKKLP
jgi:transposase